MSSGFFYAFIELRCYLQVGNAVLGSCVYGDMPSCGPGQLSLQDIRRLASLQELLAALLPAGALLTQLELIGDLRRGSPLPPLLAQPHGLEGCTQLATLESLSLHRMARDPADAELNRVLQTLLPQAPQLHKLSLGDCEVGQMPSCVATATRLRQLHLVGCGLTHLPDGQYLEGLQLLALRRNSFDELPRALTAATRLRELQWDGANLTEADVQAVLARLPHLTTYVLERPSPAVVDCITRAVPAIDVQVRWLLVAAVAVLHALCMQPHTSAWGGPQTCNFLRRLQFVRSDAKLEPLAPWGLRGPAYI